MNLVSKFLIPSYRTCGWNKEERAASVNDIIITAKWSLSRLQGNIGGVAALIAYMTSRSIDFFLNLLSKCEGTFFLNPD